LKNEYNRDIRQYNSITKQIQIEEAKLEEVDKQIASVRYKQTTHISMINSDFVTHFNELAISVNSDVIRYFIEFMGFTKTPYGIIKVI
jgi:hypothetical protein